MKFQVTYRLRHPEYLPVVCYRLLEAQRHSGLDTALTRLVMHWESQGYTVQVLNIKKEATSVN